MIKIDIKKDSISIKGHSGYNTIGKDIVCASVSSIAITTVNALLRIDKNCVKYDQKDGYLNISIKKHNKTINALLENMIDLFEKLESQYSKYIKINEEV